MKTLVLFGCASHRQGPRAIAQAKACGLLPVLIDTADNLACFNSVYVGEVEQWEITDKSYDAAYPIINELAENHDLVAIYTFEEYSVETCAKLNQAFTLPGSSPEAVKLVRDKSLCRARLREAGLAQPLSARVSSIDEARLFMQRAGTDAWIIKPLDAAGSQGVNRVARDNEGQLARAIAGLLPEQQKHFLIEQFISGQEYSIEGFFCAGQPVFFGITAKSLFPGEGFIEKMHIFPADLAISVQKKILQQVASALDITRLSVGHFHVECWLYDETVIIGEIHNRPGGDYIHLLTEIATGTETYAAVFRQFSELPIPEMISPTAAYSAGVRYFDAPPGKLVSVTGLDVVKQHPNVILTEVNIKTGEHIPPLRQSSHRVGCMVAKHNSANALQELLKWGTARVTFEVV